MLCVSLFHPLRSRLALNNLVIRSCFVPTAIVSHRHFANSNLERSRRRQDDKSAVDEELYSDSKDPTFDSSLKDLDKVVNDHTPPHTDVKVVVYEFRCLMSAACLFWGCVSAFVWFSSVDMDMDKVFLCMKVVLKDSWDQNIDSCDTKPKSMKPGWLCTSSRCKPP